MAKLEVYGSKHCQYTAELLEELEWQGQNFHYYDVADDPEVLKRMMALTGNRRHVPVLLEDGELKTVGYQGRSCVV